MKYCAAMTLKHTPCKQGISTGCFLLKEVDGKTYRYNLCKNHKEFWDKHHDLELVDARRTEYHAVIAQEETPEATIHTVVRTGQVITQPRLVDTTMIPPVEPASLRLQRTKGAGMYKLTDAPPAEDGVLVGSGTRGLQTHPMERKIVEFDMTINAIREVMEAQPEVTWHGLSGMAEGFDSLIAKAYIELGIPWTAVIPSKDYGPYYWGRRSLTGQNRMRAFEDLLSAAERVVYIKEHALGLEGMQGVYYNAHNNSISWDRANGRHINFIRNDWMVEHGTYAFIWEKNSPGTRDFYQSWVQTRKPYIELPQTERR